MTSSHKRKAEHK